ncbi:MAG: alpha/beta hydrolase [Planctomycetota bacterium]|nr:alpha/beta hydrolase [Planctomycetota bacterium]
MAASGSLSHLSARRKLLYSLLGDLPARNRPITGRKFAEEDRESYVLERWILDLNGLDPVPALFARPRGNPAPFPAILYNHYHGGEHKNGKRELIEPRDAFGQRTPWAEELARRGIASMSIDQWNFGERFSRAESEVFKEMLWKGQVMWGLMVYDNLRATDWLCARKDVDAARVGTLGLSMGSTMAWWTAALDLRMKVCIDLCCMTDYHELIATRGLDGHGIYYYVPRLLKHFDTVGVNELIAPRAHLSLNGNYDKLTPPKGLDKIDRELKKIYRSAGAPDAWKMFRRDTGHFETAEMRAEIMAFIDTWL